MNNLANHKILIIEDVAALTIYMSDLCHQAVAVEEMEIVSADSRNGYEALCIHRPAMVIMDLLLRNGTGVSLARQIWQESPCTKILFWTQIKSEAQLREIA